jgi:hypothetical protein
MRTAEASYQIEEKKNTPYGIFVEKAVFTQENHLKYQ